ncbi:hypothetical protein IAR50_006874 [Cryptococcus sp. DSM 104548]
MHHIHLPDRVKIKLGGILHQLLKGEPWEKTRVVGFDLSGKDFVGSRGRQKLIAGLVHKHVGLVVIAVRDGRGRKEGRSMLSDLLDFIRVVCDDDWTKPPPAIAEYDAILIGSDDDDDSDDGGQMSYWGISREANAYLKAKNKYYRITPQTFYIENYRFGEGGEGGRCPARDG